MEAFDRTLFLLLNAGADASGPVVLLARLSAEWLVYLMSALLVVAWLRGRDDMRRGVFYAALIAALSLAGNFAIATAWFHPRPFMLGLGVQRLPHPPETSFPSDHATLAFSLALGLFLAGRVAAAIAAAGAALVVAWSRIYLGVHFPSDIAGSALLSGTVAFGVRTTRPVIDAHLLPRVLGIYRRACRALRLPAWIARR